MSSLSPTDFYFLESRVHVWLHAACYCWCSLLSTARPRTGQGGPTHLRCVLPPGRAQPSRALWWPSPLSTALSGNPTPGSRALGKLTLWPQAGHMSSLFPLGQSQPEECSPDAPSALGLCRAPRRAHPCFLVIFKPSTEFLPPHGTSTPQAGSFAHRI